MDDMNDSRSWAHGSRYYEQLKVVADLNNSRLWAQGSRCYEQLKVVDGMNNLGCCELKPQDSMNNSWLRMILMILGSEPMTLISINDIELWMTWTTLSGVL